jgi:serine/threonine protein kinase
MTYGLPLETLLENGKYKILGILGQGGFGITYKALHTVLGTLVAVKEFYPQEYAQRQSSTGQIVPITSPDAYDRALKRFIREGRILENIHHNSIVRVRDLFEERGTAYLVMELIQGRTLRDELDAQPDRRLRPARIGVIMEALVSALSLVHQQDIYHLDLKPENILLTDDRQVKLIDFGAARQGFSSKTTRAYSPSYAPPELIAGQEVGPASDLFELGMVLYEMLAGEVPANATQRLMSLTMQGEDLLLLSPFEQPWQQLLSSALPLRIEQRAQSVAAWWNQAHQAGNPASGSQHYHQPVVPKPDFVAEDPWRPASSNSQDTIPAPQRSLSTSSNASSGTPSNTPSNYRRDLLLFLGASGVAVLGFVAFALNQPKPVVSDPPKPVAAANPSNPPASEPPKPEPFKPAVAGKTAQEWFDQGFAKKEAGNNQGAIDDYSQAIALKPDYAEAYHNRGLSRSALDDNRGAIDDYNQALKYQPNYPEAYHNRGVSREALGDNRSALEDYSQAIKLKSDYALPYLGRGNARYALDDKKNAIDDYTQVIKLKSEYAYLAHNGRGLARASLGDNSGAIDDYTQAIKLKPDFPNAYYNRGLRYREQNVTQLAIADFQKAADLYQQQGKSKDHQDAVDQLKALRS